MILLHNTERKFIFSGIIYTSAYNISIPEQPIWCGAQSTHQHSFTSEEFVCGKSRIFFYCFCSSEIVHIGGVHQQFSKKLELIQYKRKLHLIAYISNHPLRTFLSSWCIGRKSNTSSVLKYKYNDEGFWAVYRNHV